MELIGRRVCEKKLGEALEKRYDFMVNARPNRKTIFRIVILGLAIAFIIVLFGFFYSLSIQKQYPDNIKGGKVFAYYGLASFVVLLLCGTLGYIWEYYFGPFSKKYHKSLEQEFFRLPEYAKYAEIIKKAEEPVEK